MKFPLFKRNNKYTPPAQREINILIANLQKDVLTGPVAANQLFCICHNIRYTQGAKATENLGHFLETKHNNSTFNIHNFHRPDSPTELNNTPSVTNLPSKIDIIIYTFLLAARSLNELSAAMEFHDKNKQPHTLLLGITPLNPKALPATNDDISKLKSRLKLQQYLEFDPWGSNTQTAYNQLLDKITAILTGAQAAPEETSLNKTTTAYN